MRVTVLDGQPSLKKRSFVLPETSCVVVAGRCESLRVVVSSRTVVAVVASRLEPTFFLLSSSLSALDVGEINEIKDIFLVVVVVFVGARRS